MSLERLHTIEQRCPEWTPWLSVLRETLHELAGTRWDSTVPRAPPAAAMDVPLLEGAEIPLEASDVARFFTRLARAATLSGAPNLKRMDAAAESADAIGVFLAALQADAAALARFAVGSGMEREPFQAVAGLLPVPFLYSCARQWFETMPGTWTRGYCPVCAGWPAFAEMCGVERTRYLRCARCGSKWHLPCLACAYCGTTDHEMLGTLVADEANAGAAVEVCNHCGGYLKAFTRLRPCAPAEVIVDDLASAELDIAVATRGFRRSEAPARVLSVTIATRARAA